MEIVLALEYLVRGGAGSIMRRVRAKRQRTATKTAGPVIAAFVCYGLVGCSVEVMSPPDPTTLNVQFVWLVAEGVKETVVRTGPATIEIAGSVSLPSSGWTLSAAIRNESDTLVFEVTGERGNGLSVPSTLRYFAIIGGVPPGNYRLQVRDFDGVGFNRTIAVP